MSAATVCILTAGKGTRMGNYGANLNKALLPLDKKAIISHIIEKFPKSTHFVIATGYLSEQVETYLKMAHPECHFTFVKVDKYEGPGSGPGYSLLCCKQFLEKPFFFVASDTIWSDDPILPTDHDWFGVAEVPADKSISYCNFEIDRNNQIVAIRDKEKVSGQAFRAFVGLCFVNSHADFWSGLMSQDLIKGEHQVSNGIKALVLTGHAKALQVNWIDTGDADKYEHAVRLYENFDFSKSNEALYILNKRVIKYFADTKISTTRVKRARLNPTVFPNISDSDKGFFWYPLVDGNTLYEHATPEIVRKLLNWLDRNLWLDKQVPAARMQNLCADFYREKTLKRLADYQKKYNQSDETSIINEESIPPLTALLKRIPWDVLCSGKPTFFHGDLQFDNILFDSTNNNFTLLDWRQDFAGEIEFGDQYYDLAKLAGGLILNYDYIKKNLFSYAEEGNVVSIDFARRFQAQSYATILKEFVESKRLDWSKIQLLVPIIFLNMSPLHHYPFDKFLFALGRKLLHVELNRIGR